MLLISATMAARVEGFPRAGCPGYQDKAVPERCESENRSGQMEVFEARDLTA